MSQSPRSPDSSSDTHQSIFYSSTVLYSVLMRGLYGRHFQERYRAISAEIPAGVSVVEICAGDCYLYRHYLRRKSVEYQALDISPQFVHAAMARGIPMREFDVRREAIPAADIVLMQASLYQFLPDARPVMNKMLDSARQKVIIAEPIRNLSDSGIPVISALAKRFTKPRVDAAEYAADRFDEASLVSFFESFDTFERTFLIPDGREMAGIFRGRCRD